MKKTIALVLVLSLWLLMLSILAIEFYESGAKHAEIVLPENIM